jgi:hypothetical protein
VQPLNLRAEIAKNAERCLRRLLQLFGRHRTCARDFAFNHKLGHLQFIVTEAAAIYRQLQARATPAFASVSPAGHDHK